MFLHIAIHLTGPICSCGVQQLGWSIPSDADGNPCLLVSCELCGTRLHVPSNKFGASFHLKVPYPNVSPKSKPEPEPVPDTSLKVLDGGKLLPFSEEKDDDPPEAS